MYYTVDTLFSGSEANNFSKVAGEVRTSGRKRDERDTRERERMKKRERERGRHCGKGGIERENAFAQDKSL